MATTTEIRSIMRHFGCDTIYTNKTRKNPGVARRVKCVAPCDIKVYARLLNELIRTVGAENVSCHTNERFDWALPSITVACDLG